MQSALDEFDDSISRVRHLHGLHSALSATLTTAVDVSDILRAEVVMVVSALDRYVHTLARLGMLESYAGARPKTDAFNRFPVPLSVTPLLRLSATAASTLDSEIRTKHSHLSFQHPDKIAEAVRLFSAVSLWEAVGAEMDMTAADVKATLGLIVDRRNKIAHEADVDPSFPRQLWPINRAMVEGMIDIVESVGHGIHAACV
jgi:hypothetical protein